MTRLNEHYIKSLGSIATLKNVLTHLRSAKKAIDQHTCWRVDTGALYLESISKYSNETQRLITEIDAILTDAEDRCYSDFQIHRLRDNEV